LTSPSSLSFSSTGMFSWAGTSGRKFPGCFRFQRATQSLCSLTQTLSKEEDHQRRSKLNVHVLWSPDWFRLPGFSMYPISYRGCLVEHVPGNEPRARPSRMRLSNPCQTSWLPEDVELLSRFPRRASTRGRSTIPASLRMRLSIPRNLLTRVNTLKVYDIGDHGLPAKQYRGWRQKATAAAHRFEFTA